MNPITKKLCIAAGVIVAVLLVAWGAGFFYYSGHLLPHTYCSGQDVSGLTVGEASERTSLVNWKLRIVEGENEWFLSSKDVGLTMADVDFNEVIKEQNAVIWPASFASSETRHDVEQRVTYDAELATKSIAAMPFATDPARDAQSDAAAVLADDKRSFVIKTEGIGSKVDLDMITSLVLSELDGYAKAGEGEQTDLVLPVDDEGVPTLDIVAHNAYLHPEATSDNSSLVDAVNKANQWLCAEITYDIDGIDSAEIVTPEVISQWVTVERTDNVVKYNSQGSSVDESSEARFDAILHEDKVRSWLAQIGKKYDTVFCGKDITPANGKKRFVPGGQSYGWMTDESAEFDRLTSDIRSGNVVHREFATKQEGKTPQAKFSGRYLEVSLDDQHIYLFDDGKIIWDARTVTGAPGYETITGTFEIYAMQRNAILVGPDEDEDESPDYESEVSYWMPFSGGYGLHDATSWRGDDPEEYGEGVNYTNGSHGCCNLTGPDAEYLYSMAYVGMVVYVH